MSEDNKPYDPFEHEPMPEGEEKAPPLVRTMAVVRWVILAGMTIFALVMILNYFGVTPWATSTTAAAQYNCPMHPTYVSNQPGECPICGMSLVRVNKEGKEIQSGGSVAGTSASPESGHEMPVTSESSASQMSGQEMAGMTQPPSSQQGVSDMGIAPVPGLIPIAIEPKRLQLIDVRTGAVERRSLDGNLGVVGFITPDETRVANLHLRFNGWVKELQVDQTGQLVKEGERLLSVYSQELYQAEQDYIIARQALDRGPKEGELASTRRNLLDAARQRLELLGVPADELSRLDAETTPSSELWVRSPFSGYVMEKNVVKGQYVGPDQNLFSIVDLSKVWVLADVYERDITGVRIGQKARMTTTAYAGESFGGRVDFIYPSISAQTRTLKIRLVFANPSMRLRPGMYSEIELEGSGKSVLAVPVDAVMDDGNRQYVFVVHEGGRFEPRLVKIGQKSDDFAEVLSGLTQGELVVTSANFLIDSESRLKAAIAGMGGTESRSTSGTESGSMPGMKPGSMPGM